MGILGTMTVNFGSNLSGLTSGISQAQSTLNGFGGVAKGALGGVTGVAIGLGVAAVGIGIAATKMAADYQQSMLKVQALTGASDNQMKQFDSGLKKLSMDTGVAPKQLADGLYNVISAGYKGADAMTVLSLATKDSVIGMTSATVTTDALTNVMASFGMGAQDASQVNGEMLETVTLGKSTFEQYANSIVKSASAANQFHVSMETMNAAFATMTSSGIKAAQASTDFQSSLKVMDGNIGTVSKSLNKNGIAFDETKFNAMDYGHQVVYLNSALEEANAKHVKVTGVTLQAAQAISTIATHIDTYNTDLATLSDKQAMADKTQQAWSITQQGFTVSLERLRATASVVMIDIGQKLLPIATWGVNQLNGALQAIGPIFTYISNVIQSVDLSGFNKAWQNVRSEVEFATRKFEEFIHAIAPLKTDFDPIAQAIQNLAKGGLKVATDFLWNLSGAFNTVERAIQTSRGPIGVIREDFRQLTPAVQFLGDTTRLLGKDFGKVFDAIGGIGTRVFNQFKDAIDGVKGKTDAVNNFLSGIPGLSLLSGSKLDELKGKVQGVANTLTQQKSAGFLDTLNDKMKSLSSGALKGITDDIGRFGQHVNDFANYLSHVDTKPFVDGIIQVGGAFKNIASLQWDQFKTVLKDIGEDAKQVGGWFLSSVVPAMKQAAPGFASLGMTMLTTVIPAFIQVRGVVIDVIQHAFEKFAPIIEQIVPPLIRFAGILAKDVSDGLQFIMPYVIQATTAIGRFADEIIDRVAPIVSGWIKALTPLVQMFMDNWNKNWPLTLALLQSVWGMIVGVVQVAWAIVSGIIKIGLDILGGNWKQAWTDFSDMLGGIWDGIKTYLKGAWDGIRALVGAAFGKLGTDAMDAGGNIIKQLAAGITGALNFVSDAIKSVTQFISDHLPHSPAKIGPLRDLMLQGSMIPDQIAQGMLGNQSKLNSAIAQLAKPISASLNLRSSSYPSGTSNNSAAILAAVASSTSSSGNNNQNAEFHIYLDSKEITAKVGNNMASAIRAKGVRNR